LQPWFEGRVFSGADVARAKPAPDLFLHAALRMGFEPSRCLVIEDSEMGIRAALAAGMAVWHFRGGAHTSPTYVLPQDAKVDAEIADMRQLLDMFRQARLCGG
jgi:beta-phosphoglucomutase-like phosphatase (HAD superfamily)